MNANKSDTTDNFHLPKKYNSLAGNCLVLFVQAAASVSGDPSVNDNTGTGTWAVAKSVTSANQRVVAMVKTNAAAGVNSINIVWPSADIFQGIKYLEFAGISQAAVATALDGTSSATAVVGSPVASGAITTTVDGCLILQYGTGDGGTVDNLTSFVKGSGFTLALTEVFSSAGAVVNEVVQYRVQTTHGAITPTYTYTGGGGACQNDTIAIALKPDSNAGTLPTAGVMRIAGVQQTNVPLGNSSLTLQFPHEGNLIAAMIEHQFDVTGITDGDGHTWVGDNQHLTALQVSVWNGSWRAVNVAPNTDMTGPVITWSASNDVAHGFVTLYDIVNANVSPYAQSATAQGTDTVVEDLTSVSITPQFQNSIVLVECQIDIHTVSDLVTPSAANGGAADLANTPGSDGGASTFSEDNGHGHWYNGASLSAQSFIWSIQHNAVGGISGWGAIATEYKGPFSAAPSPTPIARRFLGWTA